MLDCLTYNFFGRSLWVFEKAGMQHRVLVDGRLSANESVFLAEAALQGRVSLCNLIIQLLIIWLRVS